MRAVVARVARAAVHVEGATVGEIGPGLLVLLGVHRDDPARGNVEAAAVMARKLHELRILDGERSCAETGAPLLVVSQFTLYGDTRKGRRPSWSAAAPPDRARPLVDAVVAALRARGATVATGVFGAAMAVESVNDGPFTVLVEVVRPRRMRTAPARQVPDGGRGAPRKVRPWWRCARRGRSQPPSGWSRSPARPPSRCRSRPGR